jgi:thiamine pyrophosphate-dependent acetolactate synthase large subunit-like protein
LRLAEGLGCHAARAASADHLTQSVRQALVADRPTLIEVRQDSPWLLPSAEAARGDVAPGSGR